MARRAAPDLLPCHESRSFQGKAVEGLLLLLDYLRGDPEYCEPRMFAPLIERFQLWLNVRRIQKKERMLPKAEQRPAWMMQAMEAINYGRHSEAIQIIDDAEVDAQELKQRLIDCGNAMDRQILLFKLQNSGYSDSLVPLMKENPLSELPYFVLLTGGFVADQLEKLGRAKSPLYSLPEGFEVLRLDYEEKCLLIWGERNVPREVAEKFMNQSLKIK